MPQAASIHQKHFPKQVEHYVTLEDEENMQIHLYLSTVNLSESESTPMAQMCSSE